MTHPSLVYYSYMTHSLGGGPVDLGAQAAGMSESEKSSLRAQIEAELREQLQANAAMLTDNTDFNAQLATSQKEDAALALAVEKQKKDQNRPRLSNLNEDPMLSGVVHHYITDNGMVIGRYDSSCI